MRAASDRMDQKTSDNFPNSNHVVRVQEAGFGALFRIDIVFLLRASRDLLQGRGRMP